MERVVGAVWLMPLPGPERTLLPTGACGLRSTPNTPMSMPSGPVMSCTRRRGLQAGRPNSPACHKRPRVTRTVTTAQGVNV